ncbi:unnamed protein product [Larinioides sclopetarius]|uniref:PABS domain-containing protein n=1 Tax=Larinioides sclopetarius TaxID=280406 RepID=A0AAV2AQC5_9ARAC
MVISALKTSLALDSQKRYKDTEFKAILDEDATHGMFLNQGVIKITLPYLTSHVFIIAAWGTLRRKKRQLTTLLVEAQNLQVYAHDKILNFIVIMISITVSIFSILLTLLLNESNEKRFFYGFEVENYWAKIVIMMLKNGLYCVIYPCIAHAITLLYCVLCLRCLSKINFLCEKITQCSPANFGISKQLSILKNRIQIRDILFEVEAVFAVPVFCAIVGNILMCASVIGWYLVKEWNDTNIAWKMNIAFYAINAFSNVMATAWVASELAISMKKFKETLIQKTEKRLLYCDAKGEQYLKTDLLAEPDFVLTGCNIIYFNRSTILALADYNVPTTTKFGLDSFKKGWYTETGTNAGDQAMSVKVEKILYQGKSKYQDIVVFESAKWGRVLALDNAVQLTEMDEFSWQEMATYLPLNSHPNPKKVLVIGGGDGGTVRDITKHPLVESVTMCEIDETVIEMSKKYLPFMAKGFDSPKLTLHIGDGVEFMKNHQNEFDVIITDSTDPKGRKQ